jgi:NTE family protein
MSLSSESNPVLIDLALQGGGSHGAFTWGVLYRLLEESWLRIAGISGTSAGAMNAAILANGWTKGGAEGARATLDQFWRRVSRAASLVVQGGSIREPSELICARFIGVFVCAGRIP